MVADGVTFGWVIRPSTPASSGTTEGRDPSALTAELLAHDRAFIEALPPQFTTLWVEDHFQWDANPTLEAFTTMTYFAALYPSMRIGSIVLGQSYRNPALTAKMAATLHALTGGRFILGIGAGWKQDEYVGYGYPYPNPATRIDQLDEAVQIIKTMFRESPASFHGKYYHIEQAYCEPRPNPPMTVMIGGSGEKKTLRVVAKHADWWNGGFYSSETYAQKQAVLAEHCRAIGRDPREIVPTYYGIVDLSEEQPTTANSSTSYSLNGDAHNVVTELRKFMALGVRHFLLGFNDFPALTGLETFTREVLPALDLT